MAKGSDQWLVDYERATSKADECQAAVNERDRLSRGMQSTSKVASQVRRLLNELAMNVNALEDVLNEAGRRYHITDAELLRRQNLVATLKGRKDDLTGRFSRGPDASSAAGGGRSQLLGQDGGRDTRYEDDETTRGVDSNGMMQQHDLVMREQDKGLDLLQQSIARQKQLGLVIGNELDDQNEKLEDLSEAMDNTDRRLTRETHHVVRVTEKAKSGGMMCCIVLLILAIIIVAAVPM